MSKPGIFRMAVRKFAPFESAIRKQWEIFEAHYRTGLVLEAVALDLHPLHESLFAERNLERGGWDAALVSTDWLAEADECRGLLNLAPYLKASPPEDFPHAWSDSLRRLQQFGSRVLGLPYHDGPECLIYRRDLFEDAGEGKKFAAEFGEPLTVPRTWQEFRRAARFLTRPSASLYGTAFAGFPDGHNTVYDFCLQLWSRGGELFDRAGRIHLATAAAREALDYYRELISDPDAVHPGSPNFDSVKSGLAFAAGEVAMMVNWFGFAAMSETLFESKVKGRVGVAPIPAGGGPRVSLNAYWVIGIAAGSAQREIAWQFLRHCASPAMDKLVTLEGAIGCRKSTWRDAEVNATVPFYHLLEQLHGEARELPRLKNWSRIAGVIDRMTLEAIHSDEPSDTIIAKAQTRVDLLRVEELQAR
jgi:multiple sugar transport system substrate-binding protein